ncbi:ferrous iron transport protein A [Waterburya agarophytonicola K14]|uniref:Ferrous iron transport protein A n=1 Tax=Waterburya agarophytonicola KI4 TaxID=2874699 RepID=A0A964BY63_9CYAN|nr:FeoA family protein [Waterburya agarophytonicola]MCC0179330.1 ferrous iron transport protein A [Waterburya agarophytonicola KI4]
MTLAELESGKLAVVKHLKLNHQEKELGKRLLAIGITPDKQIQVIRKASFGGPLHIRLGSTTEIAIRRQEAKMVQVHCLNSL